MGERSDPVRDGNSVKSGTSELLSKSDFVLLAVKRLLPPAGAAEAVLDISISLCSSIEETNADVKKNVPFGLCHFVLKEMFVNV